MAKKDMLCFFEDTSWNLHTELLPLYLEGYLSPVMTSSYKEG